jgi:chromosome partitioning protein
MAETSGAGPVALIDTDPQGSLAAWWNAREQETPHYAPVDVRNLAHHLQALEEAGIALVIIDTPPAVTETIAMALAVADLVLIPTRPSPHDLRAVALTVSMVEEAKKRMVFIINGAVYRARITTDAAIALSEHGAVAPVVLHQRTDYAASMIDGRTTFETDPHGKSAKEIHDLWKYVSKQIDKKTNS